MFWSVAIERIRVTLPQGFDPTKHGAALVAKVNGDNDGGGFDLDNIDMDSMVATLSRQASITEVKTGGGRSRDSFELKLPRGTKPADGPKFAARYEDQYGDKGYYLTRFEPFLGIAEMSKLSVDTVRCRAAAALALGAKEWEVQVTPRQDGGFDIELPKTYTPSKHDGKMTEVAEAIVGQMGWYWQANAKNLCGSIIPSDPPTFPSILPFPMKQLRREDWHYTPFGRSLPDPGQDLGPEVGIDWTAAAFGMVAGMPGAGKTVTLNNIIASQLANGVEISILDVAAKSVDFLWCKKYLRGNGSGWGCDSLPAAVTVLAMIYEEGQRRAKILADFGEVNWLNLPNNKQFTPILVIVDEVTALMTTERAPAGIPKDHPLVIEAVQHNLLVATLQKHVNKITAELRFVGIRMILSTQVTNNATGIGPSLKTKLGHKVLQGANPSEVARKQAFNDPNAVPYIPDNVRAEGQVARGVGAAELEGAAPMVYKAYFSTPSDFDQALSALGVKETSSPVPSASQIAKHTPSIEDSGDDAPARAGNASNDYGFAQQSDGEFIRDFDRKAEGGFAAANEARRQLDQTAGTSRKKKADPFDMPAASEVTVRRVESRTPDQNNPFASSPD